MKKLLLVNLLIFTKLKKYFYNKTSISVSIENIVTDVHELEKGMDQVRKESDLRGKGVHSVVLRDFLLNSEDKLKRLKADAKSSQDVFRECVEYFGESHRTTDANTFFSLLVRFARAFKVNINLFTYLIMFLLK